MDAHRINIWNFGDGYELATVDLGRSRSFLAWGSITFTDPLTDYDRDNGVAIEVYMVNGVRVGYVASGGAHLKSPGDYRNLRPGAYRGYGRRVTFRLRTFHVSDLESYGVGCVLTLS
jgi:hypothetical protein